jgi:ribonuclease E
LSAEATPEPAQAVAPAPARAPRALVEPYVLPLAQLHQIAEGAGLQWVNSDAEKIAAVQAAIAAQPRPVHVPRERKPVVVVDEGPLVLVETRKDLSQMKLPFEVGGSDHAA